MAHQPLLVIYAKSIFIHLNRSISKSSIHHKHDFFLFGLVYIYGISTIVGYLKPNQFLYI